MKQAQIELSARITKAVSELLEDENGKLDVGMHFNVHRIVGIFVVSTARQYTLSAYYCLSRLTSIFIFCE